jgi:hypothetical protein
MSTPLRCALRALRDPSIVEGAGPDDGRSRDHGLARRGQHMVGTRRFLNGLLSARPR